MKGVISSLHSELGCTLEVEEQRLIYAGNILKDLQNSIIKHTKVNRSVQIKTKMSNDERFSSKLLNNFAWTAAFFIAGFILSPNCAFNQAMSPN